MALVKYWHPRRPNIKVFIFGCYMSFFKLFKVITLTVLLCNFSVADDTQELADILKTYKTISGGFKQTLQDDKQALIQESSGNFVVKKPGFFNR